MNNKSGLIKNVYSCRMPDPSSIVSTIWPIIITVVHQNIVIKLMSAISNTYLRFLSFWTDGVGDKNTRNISSDTRSRIHDRTISVRFLVINLESSQTWGSCIQCLHYKPVSNQQNFAPGGLGHGGGGGVKSISRSDWIARRKTLQTFETFVPNSSKNLASAQVGHEAKTFYELQFSLKVMDIPYGTTQQVAAQRNKLQNAYVPTVVRVSTSDDCKTNWNKNHF